MSVRVIRGVASLTTNIPVFIGTTGDMEQCGDVGDRLFDFVFEPKEDDVGILVFDHVDPQKRTSTSPTFFRYWWEGSILKVREVEEGMTLGILKHTYQETEEDGILHIPRRASMESPNYGWFCTHPSDKGYRKTDILDMLRFLEGKITIEELDKRAAKAEK